MDFTFWDILRNLLTTVLYLLMAILVRRLLSWIGQRLLMGKR